MHVLPVLYPHVFTILSLLQVRRSRNCKKALHGCKNDLCVQMLKRLQAAEKVKELLLKAACAPHTLSRTERVAYSKLITARAVENATGQHGDVDECLETLERDEMEQSQLSSMGMGVDNTAAILSSGHM